MANPKELTSDQLFKNIKEKQELANRVKTIAQNFKGSREDQFALFYAYEVLNSAIRAATAHAETIKRDEDLTKSWRTPEKA